MTVRKWGSEATVNTSRAGVQSDPSVAALEGGGFVVSWTDAADPTNLDVRAQRFDALGKTVGGELNLRAGGADEQNSAVIGFAGGNFAIVYEFEFSATDRDVALQRYNADGTPLSRTIIFSAEENERFPDIARFGNGIVVMASVPDTDPDIRLTTSAQFNGNFVSAVNANSTTAGGQLGVSIAALGTGGYAASWGSGLEIRARAWDAAGVAVTNDFLVATGAVLASTAALSGTVFAVGYLSTVDPLQAIRVEFFRTDGTQLGDSVRVSPPGLAVNAPPELVAIGSERVLVVWAPSGGGLTGQVVGLGGIEGAAFRLDAPDRAALAAAALADGRVVISWAGADDIQYQIVDPRDGLVEGTAAADALHGHLVTSDELNGYAGADRLFGLGGDDALYAGSGDDFLEGGEGDDYLDGGAGADTASYADSPLAMIVDLGVQLTWNGNFNETLVGIENAIGSAFADRIWGTAEANVIDGGTGGADELNGYGGIDTVSYASATRGNIIDLGAGANWDGVEGDRVLGFENVIGTAFNDSIFGTPGDNIIDGGSGGQDYLNGDRGFDTLSFAGFTAGPMIVDFTARRYWNGTQGGDILDFEAVIGTTFADSLFGDAAATLFIGGSGADTIVTGGGADRVRFTTPGDFGDTIRDFRTGIDRIEFAGDARLVTSAGVSLTQATLISGLNPAPGPNGALLYNTANGELRFDPDGFNPQPAVLLAVLTGAPTFAASDLFLI